MAFELNDVRESYTNDITRFLSDIEKGAKAVVSAATLTIPPERTWHLPINSMVVGLHGIVGSSSLVGVTSLSSTARRLEDIAGLASESVRLLRAHANRLKLIANICLEGSSELRVILEHELAGRKADAATRQASLDKQLDLIVKEIDEQLHPPTVPERSEITAPASKHATIPPLPKSAKVPAPAVPPPAAKAKPTPAAPPLPMEVTDDGWEDTVVSGGARSAAPMSPDDELAMVFQAEAREALTNLRGYLTRLEQQPNDREAATQCARLFHLLKGAAASVGLADVADRARDLHSDVEKMKAVGIDAAAVGRLRTDAEAFIAFVVPDLASQTPAKTSAAAPTPVSAPPAPSDDDPASIFRDEARSAIEEIRTLLRSVRETTGTQRGVMTSRIERLLHRLKGSALIVGAAPIAAVASRGQALCEALERVDPDALGNVVEQINSMLPSPAAQAPAQASLVKINLPRREEWDTYLEESGEILDNVDQILSVMEASSRPTEDLSNLFRNYHTLKGASNAVGLSPIGQHLHIIETFLERIVAAPRIDDLRNIVKVLSEQNQAIRRNITTASSEGQVTVDYERLQARLASLSDERPSGVSWIAPNDSAWSAERSDVERARPRRRREADSQSQSQSQSAHDYPRDSESESIRESVQESEADDMEAPAAERRFIRVPADRLDSMLDLAGELVVCRSRMLSRVSRIQSLHDDDLVRHENVIQLVDNFASATQFTNLDGRRRRLAAAGVAASGDGLLGFGSLELDQYEEIHVLSRRLDEAASDVGEVRRDIGGEMEKLSEDAEMLSTIASGLQTEITRARMLTLETLFTRLRLPIRDAAQRAEREIEIITRGEQLAIDKSMSDALYGPLLHMVRNAVVHGIESPLVREEGGKPRAGTIRITAAQVHGEIVLEIADDGRGVDFKKLRAIGVERGLIPREVEETDPRVVDMIFAKGVSTLEGADDLAGRGVGGNVIKRAIDRLNGTIQVSSQVSAGTMFRITLPLSTSITQAVLVRVGGVLLAIPIAYAETILSRDDVEMVDSFGRMRARIGERMVPIHQTRNIFQLGMLKSTPTDKVLVVCVVGGERVAIQVDEVVGQEEIVVKTLGMLLEGHPLFSGSTSRGDGDFVLIMDVPGVLEAETQGDRRKPAQLGSFLPAPARPVPVVEPPVPMPVGESIEPEPASDTDAGIPAVVGMEVSEVVAVPIGRLRVLFVDDSLSVRKVGERMLTSLDVDVVTAVDGQDALEKLRAMAFSLVFTDLEMPRMHGFELIREMQLLPAYQAIPVVVVSSRSGQKHIDQALSMGAREYLTKPFSPEILNAVLGRLARKGS